MSHPVLQYTFASAPAAGAALDVAGAEESAGSPCAAGGSRLGGKAKTLHTFGSFTALDVVSPEGHVKRKAP